MSGTNGGTKTGTTGDNRDMPRIADGGTLGGRHPPPLGGDVPNVPSAASRDFRDVPFMTYLGQNYWFDGVGQHVTRGGATIATLKWKTDCATCGREFGLFTVGKFGPSRRCQSCKAPGQRVESERLRKGVG